MTLIQQSIDVGVPLDIVQREWNEFLIRRLMGHYSVAEREIAWTPADDAEEAGTVWFQDIDGDSTRVTLRVEFDPHEMTCEKADPDACSEDALLRDLKKFKAFAEDIAKGDRDAADRVV